MKRSLAGYILMLPLLYCMVACSVSRRVPEGKFLLTKNIVVTDKDTPKKDRIKSEAVENFIQPEPNRRFLGTNLYLQLYNLSNPDTTRVGWWNRTLRKLGEVPVLLDTSLVSQSAEYIKNYAVYSGFYDAKVDYKVETRRKKAKVTYYIEQNEPYRIGSIQYVFRDEFLRPIVMRDSVNTLLKPGDLLDGHVLTSEKGRITEYLRNNGYYEFTQKNIEFVGDSTKGDRTADITVLFRQYLSGYTPQGTPIYENNSIYRISELVVNPDYDPMKAASDPDYYIGMDTVDYRGLKILHPAGTKLKVRKKILRQAINLYPNYLYSSREVQQAYSNIMRLGYYKNASIVFDTIEDADTTDNNEVTFIGSEGEASFLTTTEKYMTCHINCIPALKQSYKIELEGTTSSNYNALSATIGYQNRNLLRGVELFDISLRGGYEFMRNQGTKGSFEIGGTTSMSFPRFITPFNVDPYNRRVNPRTKVELTVSSQRRTNYYNRTLSSVSWGYSWSNRHKSSFILKPIDLNLVKISNVTEDFLNSLSNEYLRSSYKDQLVAGISGSFIYNTQMNKPVSYSGGAFLFRFNFETAGNLIEGLSHLFNSKTVQVTETTIDSGGGVPIETHFTREEFYRIFGIRYAQYFRVDASISDRLVLGPRTNIAYRLYGGVGLSYGNAKTLPFDRFFYSGGSNSMRGWVPRTLGPGNVIPNEQSYLNQLGNMKLEANAELRFPVWGILNGALFFDVGNIWFVKEGTTDNPDAIFKLNRFYKQLGFNTGLGIRFDIGMAVLRFDWGMRVHDPNLEKGERWIDRFSFSNTVLNFGVGYPF